jgi:hypothetical protein
MQHTHTHSAQHVHNHEYQSKIRNKDKKKDKDDIMPFKNDAVRAALLAHLLVAVKFTPKFRKAKIKKARELADWAQWMRRVLLEDQGKFVTDEEAEWGYRREREGEFLARTGREMGSSVVKVKVKVKEGQGVQGAREGWEENMDDLRDWEGVVREGEWVEGGSWVEVRREEGEDVEMSG